MRERAVRSGRVAQLGLGDIRQRLRPFAPGPADWRRDVDELLSAVRVRRDLTRSAPARAGAALFLSSAPAGAEPDRTRVASRGGAARRPGTYGPDLVKVWPAPAVAPPSISTRNHARETRALPSDQLGAREDTPAPEGPELVPVPEVRAYCHGQKPHVSTVNGESISWCWGCGLTLSDLKGV